MIVNTGLYIILLIFYTLYVWQQTKSSLHVFQQNRYEWRRFRSWQKDNVTKTYPLYVLVTWFVALIVCLIFDVLVFRLFCIIAMLALQWINQMLKDKEKVIIKPLVYTNRVKRQIATWVIIYIILIVVTYYVHSFWLLFIVLAAFSIYQMQFIGLVALLNAPFENLMQNRFMKKAQRKLNSYKNLTTIGITGSYGKTSSKNIILNILLKKYYCLATPASYNTPMGISITINNELEPTHQIFICEMGADKKGEITELFNFVNPKIGVVTSIGEQHLATFKTQENIIEEKMQLVELMPADGFVVLNKDEKYIREYDIKTSAKLAWYSIEEDSDIKATNIEYSKDGSKFDVSLNGEIVSFETKLLGTHNIYNILAGIAIGLHFNIPIKELQIAVKRLNYIPHRLEIKKQKDYTIIDNAFNSNPVAAKISLDVLARMPNKRICITPGMIDLGQRQDYHNREFGKYFVNRCDEVILVGRKQTRAIYDGLEESGFNMSKVHVVNRIFDAYSLLEKIKTPDCYVLLENDLPDAFNV